MYWCSMLQPYIPDLLWILVYPGFLAGLCLLSHLVLPGGQLDQSAHHDPANRDMVHHHCVIIFRLVHNGLSVDS